MAKGLNTLSPREKAFVRAYVTSANANPTVAAVHAGYQGSQVALRQQGLQLMRSYRIRQAIDRRLRREQVALPGQILKEVSDIATAPWREFIEIIRDEDGNEVEVKLKLGEKLKAAEMLLKVHGQLTDPATRLMDRMMRTEMLAVMRAQREQTMKAQRLDIRKRRAKLKARRLQQLALPAGSPGGPALEIPRVEAGHELTKPTSK